VSDLRSGVAHLQDNPEEGRSLSLQASLNYGFNTAFTDDEKRKLSIVYLFQAYVSINVFCALGKPDSEWVFPPLAGITTDDGLKLLNGAVEIGLLSRSLNGDGHYDIHPAVFWYFKSVFEEYYRVSGLEDKALRAYVFVIAHFGETFSQEYINGNQHAIAALKAYESNLLHALRWQVIRDGGTP